MTLLYLELLVVALCLGALLYLSLIESAAAQSSPLSLRTMLEREEREVPELLHKALEDRMEFLIPLHFGAQAAFITAIVLLTHIILTRWPVWGLAYSLACVFVLSIVFRQLLPRLLTQNNPESKLASLLAAAGPLYAVLRFLAFPLAGVLKIFRGFHADPRQAADPESSEATEEEIQAYLDIGEDEGIIEEEDSKLIQSVVEFGDTLVREVMTPRTLIVACSETASIGELRDTMVNHRHSRIPIYRGDIDHIIGIAYIRQLLAQYTQGRESDAIANLIQPALFVPETKRVSALLKELQERGGHAAIVIDEYGGVAGMVTLEDLLEEIVGEIRDEDQAKISEIVEEGPRSFVFRGSTELYRLEELAGRKFDGIEASTVAGLITAFLGRVPSPGEEFDLEGLRIQVLDADRKRVRRVRFQFPSPAAPPE